jgi:hypothetical protein
MYSWRHVKVISRTNEYNNNNNNTTYQHAHYWQKNNTKTEMTECVLNYTLTCAGNWGNTRQQVSVYQN